MREIKKELNELRKEEKKNDMKIEMFDDGIKIVWKLHHIITINKFSNVLFIFMAWHFSLSSIFVAVP